MRQRLGAPGGVIFLARILLSVVAVERIAALPLMASAAGVAGAATVALIWWCLRPAPKRETRANVVVLPRRYEARVLRRVA